ncbi:MAG: gliding motility-associated C-terminal domain-containing protein [Bacteroidota bacterium]|nr:gliding motility-associated C-terminal domain-containing protein [Bacteroidota bacterium]
MKAFDEHIRDKMTRMEINPSREVSERIKSNKPRPGFKHIFNHYGYWFAAGVAVIGILSLVVFDNQSGKKTSHDNTAPQPQEKIDNHPQTLSTQNNTDSTDKDSKTRIEEKTDKKDVNTAKHRIIHTYSSKVMLTADKTGDWISKSEAEIINTKQNECVVYCPDYGKYEMILLNDDEGNIHYEIHYLEKPHIFTSKDTIVDALECRIFCKTKHGTWQVPDGIKLKELNNHTIQLYAQNFGRYVIIRTEKDSVDRFSDTIAVHFIASDSKFRLIKRPCCPGNSAVVAVDKGFVPKSNDMTCVKRDGNEYELTFKPSASVKVICNIVDEKSGKQIDTIVFVMPEKTDLNYELQSHTCKNNGSVFIKDNPDITEIYLDDETVEAGKYIDLEAGNYTLTWKDTRGCIDSTEITIDQSELLKADYELEISLDGFSARTTNLTSYADQPYFDNLYYEWYVNGNLQSTAKEPELQLDELINSVKLYVTDGKLCSDSMIKKDIKPDQALIRVPNFFTPNNDGYFDHFKVLVDSRLSEFSAIITSRSGQTVYKWSDPSKGWDGKIFGNENASEGVYFYIIQAYDSTGRPIKKRGTLQLIR